MLPGVSSEVVLVCEDAGAARALAPVARALRDVGRLRYAIATGAAASILRGEGLSVREGSHADDRDTWRGSPVALTGSTQWGERIEARAAVTARRAGCRVVTFLDFWSNYVARLSFPETTGLAVVPDRLAVIDARMRDEAIAAGVPAERVRVTGSPTLDAASSLPRLTPHTGGDILFLSQPLEQLYGSVGTGHALGYTERTVLEAVAHAARAVDLSVRVRPHPREDAAVLRAAIARLPGCAPCEGGTLEAACCRAAVVVGITTMALVDVALRGMPTVSVQPTETPLTLPTVELGFTRLVTRLSDLPAALRTPPTPPPPFPSSGAVGRILALLDEE